MYFLAIVLPPLAVFLSGKPITAILTLFLTCLGWIPGVIHACMVVGESKRQRREAKAEKAAAKRHKAMMKSMRNN